MGFIRQKLHSTSQIIDQFGNASYSSVDRVFQTNWVIIIIILLTGFISFYQLGAKSLQAYDEAIYAEVAKQMVIRDEYLTQYYQDQPRFEKPPLVPWIMSGFFRIFTIDEFWARAPSAIAGVLLGLVVFLIGKQVYTPQIGFIAVITLFGIHEVVRRVRFGTTDAILTLLIYVAVYAYLKLREGKSFWWYVIWLSFAFAFMVKFWAALIIPATLAIAICVDSDARSDLFSTRFWTGALAAGLIILPWHLFSIITYGKSFLDVYLIRNTIDRTTSAIEGNVGSRLFYIQNMQELFVNWVYLVPVAYAIELKFCIIDKRHSRILIILATLTFLFYSLIVTTKLKWYILPVYPALAIFIAFNLGVAYKDYRSVAFSGLIFASILGILLVSGKFLIIYLLLSLISAFFMIRYIKDMRPYQVATILLYGFLLISSIRHRVLPLYYPEPSPLADIAKVVDQKEKHSNLPIIGLALETDGEYSASAVLAPSTIFYSNRSAEEISSWKELTGTLESTGEREIIFADEYLETLTENYELEILAEGDPFIYAIIK